jgi:hypothetical protein
MAQAQAATQRREGDVTGDKTELVNHEASKEGPSIGNTSGPSGKGAAVKKVKKGTKPKLTGKEKKERAVGYIRYVCLACRLTGRFFASFWWSRSRSRFLLSIEEVTLYVSPFVFWCLICN